jgi:hypothetical protein
MKIQITTGILIVLVVMISVATVTISFAVQASAQPMNTTSTTGTTTTAVPQVNATTTSLRGNATTAGPECPEAEAGAARVCETYCCAVCTACAQRGGLCQECADNCHR